LAIDAAERRHSEVDNVFKPGRFFIALMLFLSGVLLVVGASSGSDFGPDVDAGRSASAERAEPPWAVLGPVSDNPVAAIRAMVADVMAEQQLKAVLLGIRVGDADIVSLAFGESMSGVPARTDMQSRIGAISIAYMGYLLLRLVDLGVASLDDPVGTWLPELPNAGQVTLRMLINGTSGYPDYVTYEPFIEAFYADVFRTWTPEELIKLAFEQPLRFAPGQGWSYAHTNFVILGLALERATNQPFGDLMRWFVLRPLGLDRTHNPDTPAMTEPVLHAYTPERSLFYGLEQRINEASTFWNPSWTLARGAIMTSTMADVLTAARAIGIGEGLSAASFHAMLAPETAGFAPWSADTYYGLGVIFTNGWLMQNPLFHGYSGLMAYLPERDLSVAIFATKTACGDPDTNGASAIFRRLTERFTPDHRFTGG
jgi:CubicO group peptidase (beta-lactamase class C family)